MPAKAQGGGQGQLNLRLAGGIGHIVQVAVRVGLLVPNGGGDHPLVQGHGAGNGLHRPAAPSMWPVMDLVELTMQARAASSPRPFLMARVSQASFKGVLVPWALMYSLWGSPQPPASS